MRAPGHSAASLSRTKAMVATRLCRKNAWPPRASSASSARATVSSVSRTMRVSTATRSCGGVRSSDRSRTPVIAMCSVRGIGVALSVSTSAPGLRRFSISLCATPKRCSSSITMSPRSLNFTRFDSRACVPMAMSSDPAARRSSAPFRAAGDWNRLSASTLTGRPSKRALNVSKCCCASTVVGASTAVWRPFSAAMHAARIATSVLPYPASPHTSLSIVRGEAMSRSTSANALAWSSVSTYGNVASKSAYPGGDTSYTNPPDTARRACISISVAARFRTDFPAAAFSFSQRLPPSGCSLAFSPFTPT